ncbi:hypothetical protein TNIN_72781 [Trichonephila inaurata madagascariensis]|uniref:Uncharacterized protein n=1 Tax=Trichonephila inaurata madagascariensis TaxID=2747483 RepID=A0A8X7BTT4_9ARAC|nr:hypothetical protein TNIN_72781 [Trichonephila inaurata madagascariensis]
MRRTIALSHLPSCRVGLAVIQDMWECFVPLSAFSAFALLSRDPWLATIQGRHVETSLVDESPVGEARVESPCDKVAAL